MHENESATKTGTAGRHRDDGLLRVLTIPWVYSIFRFVILKEQARRQFIDFVGPFPGCRIMDIGCGPAGVLSHLPDTIGAYVGLDMSAAYVEFARKRWRARPHCRFLCRTVSETTVPDPGSYDIVLAQSVVHHLDDEEATHLFRTASTALKAGGCVVTYDGVFIDRQHPFARWLLARDRGKAVRTVAGYERLAHRVFDDVEGLLLHRTLRVPYTTYVMKCRKA